MEDNPLTVNFQPFRNRDLSKKYFRIDFRSLFYNRLEKFFITAQHNTVFSGIFFSHTQCVKMFYTFCEFLFSSKTLQPNFINQMNHGIKTELNTFSIL